MFQFLPSSSPCPPPSFTPRAGSLNQNYHIESLHFYRVNCPTTAKHCLKMFYVVISIDSIWCRNKVPLIQPKVLPFCILYIRSQFYHTALNRFTSEPLGYKKVHYSKKYSVALFEFMIWKYRGLKVQACDICNVWIA